MVQAIASAYAGSSVTRDDRREPPGTTEDDPIPAKTDAKDPPAKPDT